MKIHLIAILARLAHAQKLIADGTLAFFNGSTVVKNNAPLVTHFKSVKSGLSLASLSAFCSTCRPYLLYLLSDPPAFLYSYGADAYGFMDISGHKSVIAQNDSCFFTPYLT